MDIYWLSALLVAAGFGWMTSMVAYFALPENLPFTIAWEWSSIKMGKRWHMVMAGVLMYDAEREEYFALMAEGSRLTWKAIREWPYENGETE